MISFTLIFKGNYSIHWVTGAYLILNCGWEILYNRKEPKWTERNCHELFNQSPNHICIITYFGFVVKYVIKVFPIDFGMPLTGLEPAHTGLSGRRFQIIISYSLSRLSYRGLILSFEFTKSVIGRLYFKLLLLTFWTSLLFEPYLPTTFQL